MIRLIDEVPTVTTAGRPICPDCGDAVGLLEGCGHGFHEDCCPRCIPCTLYEGYINKTTGYGERRVGGRAGRLRGVHRIVWEELHGPIPRGIVVDHACHNWAVSDGCCSPGLICSHRRCIEPVHLRLLTNAENLLASSWATVACKNGHPWTPANSYLNTRGHRSCRQCHADRERDRYAERSRPDPIEPEDPHTECWRASIAGAKIRG